MTQGEISVLPVTLAYGPTDHRYGDGAGEVTLQVTYRGVEQTTCQALREN